MTFFNLFKNKSRFFYVYLGLLGIVNSIWASALLMMINNKITGTPLPFLDEYDWLVYIGLISVSFIVAAFFQSYMIKLTYQLGNEMGLAIFDKLRFTSYENYMKLGEEKVRTAMRDVTTLQRFPQIFIESFNSIIMVVIGIAYLFWIDKMGALLVAVSMVVLAMIYLYRNSQISKDLNTARDLANIYMRNVNDFLNGFREVKMSTRRSDNIFLKFLTGNRNRTMNLTIKAMRRALGNELLGTYAWYFMIGIVLFLLPVVFNMSMASKTAFLVTLLYLMGPTSIVIAVMESYISMGIAINRLNEFSQTIDATSSISMGHGDTTDFNESFESIRFENVTYEYFDKEKSSTFKLKPLNLEIRKGESIFITGGNGSGKSTFINLLSGLYVPKSGKIFLNGRRIKAENLPYYRDQLSCIFTDNFLFTENYDGFDLQQSNEDFITLLKKMKLEEVVTFDGENNKIMHTLSKGQQKRMALIYSMLEDKDIFIFDEWAAEQDPEFRRYFYENIVPELVRMGKTVIAVTHDDAYFDCAQRLIKFDYGRIIRDENVKVLESYRRYAS